MRMIPKVTSVSVPPPTETQQAQEVTFPRLTQPNFLKRKSNSTALPLASDLKLAKMTLGYNSLKDR